MDLGKVQRSTFDYFWSETNPENGLIRDNTAPGDVPVSIAGVGMALTAYVVGAERGYVQRTEAADRARATLRFFMSSEQGSARDATGHRGFYYHFLDYHTGKRKWNCELSTIDSAVLLAGALTAATYFDGDSEAERELRRLADEMYRRVDWQWVIHKTGTVSHGWRPERGFIKYHWDGYSEALILYVLGLGSPTHPLPASSYDAWASTYQWKKLYDIEYLHAAPFFIHQMSHLWIDFREIQDAFMREKGIDYFENSRRAAFVQREYARENPKGFRGYNADCWGITASRGPGPATRTVDGKRRKFYGYHERGVPDGPDDGTLAPWATIASLPFAPDIVKPALAHYGERYPEMVTEHGVTCSFNPTFVDGEGDHGWVSGGHFSLDQGPVVVMIENHESAMIWNLMKRCPYIRTGLERAGFTGGWLE